MAEKMMGKEGKANVVAPVIEEVLGRVNKNMLSVKELPTIDGVKVLKILHIVVSDQGESYMCIMDDGKMKVVARNLFKEQ